MRASRWPMLCAGVLSQYGWRRLCLRRLRDPARPCQSCPKLVRAWQFSDSEAVVVGAYMRFLFKLSLIPLLDFVNPSRSAKKGIIERKTPRENDKMTAARKA